MGIDFSKLNSILFCCHESSLGDAVIDSFVFREIKKKFPNIKMYIAAHGPYYDYYSKDKFITKTYQLPIKKRLRWNQRWIELFFMALKLRKCDFDLICDFSDSTRLNWKMFKWVTKNNGLIYDCCNNNGSFGDRSKHRIDHIKAIMADIGLDNIDTSYDVFATEESEEKLKDFRLKHSINGYVCLNCFGSTDFRTFNSETINYLLSFLKDYKVVIPCMPNKLDKLAFLDKNNPNICVYRTENIFDFISSIKSCCLCVSPDTAAIHIASGCNKPVIGFYNKYCDFYAPKVNEFKIIKTDENTVNDFDKNIVSNELAQFISRLKKHDNWVKCFK